MTTFLNSLVGVAASEKTLLNILSTSDSLLWPPGSFFLVFPLLFCKHKIEKTKTTRNPWVWTTCSVSYCLSLQGATYAAPSGGNKLIRTTRVRRQAPSAASANQTLQEQPVIFNHVYNINVPLESLCSVDLDASAPPAPGNSEIFWLIILAETHCSHLLKASLRHL